MRLDIRHNLATHIHWLFAAVIVVLVFSSYCNTFQSPPVLDDFHSFIDEPLTRIDQWSLDSVVALSKTKFGWKRFIPIVTLSWDLWFGEQRIIYLHVTNFLIHLASFFAVIFLVAQLGRRQDRVQGSRERYPPPLWLAVWVAAIWALQPVQASAVTYLVQRMTSLVSLFYVLSVAFYIAARSAAVSGGALRLKPVLLYGACLGSMGAAFLCKENSAMLPMMLLLTEVWFYQPALPQRMLRWCCRHWLAAGLAAGFCFLVLAHLLPQHLLIYKFRYFTLSERLFTETRILIWYISLLLWPHPGRFSLEHDVELSTSVLHPPTTLFAIMALAVMVCFTVWKRSRYPLITYGLAWFLVNSVIESTILPLELVFEHRMYLPSVGIVLTLIVGIYHFAGALFKKVEAHDFAVLSWCLAAIWASVLTLTTFERNQAWLNILTVNADAAVKAPENPRAHANLAVAFGRIGEYREAIAAAEKAIEVGKQNYETYMVAANTIFLSHVNLGEPAKAVEKLRQLMDQRLSTSNLQGMWTMYCNLAVVQRRLGDYPAAFQAVDKGMQVRLRVGGKEANYLQETVQILTELLHEADGKGLDLDADGVPDPGGLPTRAWIGQKLVAWGVRTEGMELLEQAVQDYPRHAASRRMLEALRREEEQDRLQEKDWSFQEKYVNHPFSPFNACMAAAFLIEKHLPASMAGIGLPFLDYARRLQPDSPEALLLKGWYHYRKNENRQAVEAVKRALELKPDYAKGWLGLGFFYWQADDPEQAVQAFRKTLQLYPGCPDQLKIHDIITSLQRQELENALTERNMLN